MASHDRPGRELVPLGLKGEPSLALALSRGATITEAAEEAGVGERTVRRRLADAQYRAAVASLRTRYIDQSVGLLAEASGKAVRALVDVLETGPATARVAAAKTLLSNAISLADFSETRARIEALEQQILQQTSGHSTAHSTWQTDG